MMARSILIVDSSAARRKILASMIMANLSDIGITEARNAYDAWDRLQHESFHLILFFWEPSGEAWLNFFLRLKKHPTGSQTRAILLTTDSSHPYVGEALRVGVAEALVIPCTKMELTNAINLVCNPVTLHQSPRYSLPGTTALFQQESRSYHAKVINISLGGMLCELDYIEDFAIMMPVTVTVTFQQDGKQLVANGLYSLLTRFSVLDTNADYSPNRIRVAYRFIKAPVAVQELFREIFQLADDQENLLHL